MTRGGQSVAEQFLEAADARGFHTVFLQRQIIPPSSVRRLPGAAPRESAPTTGDASETPNPPPTESDGASGSTGGSTPSGAGGAQSTNTVPTQVVLQLTTSRARIRQRVVAKATVRAAGATVDEGAVVFIVNGLSRSASVKNGVATVDVVQMLSGRCEIRAEYQGTRRFASASALPATLIIE